MKELNVEALSGDSVDTEKGFEVGCCAYCFECAVARARGESALLVVSKATK